MYVCVCVFSGEVVSEHLAALCTVARQLLCPWDFPGKHAGVGGHFLLQGIFQTEGLNSHLLRWQVGSLPLSCQGSIYIYARLYFGLGCCKIKVKMNTEEIALQNVFRFLCTTDAGVWGHMAALGYLSEEPRSCFPREPHESHRHQPSPRAPLLLSLTITRHLLCFDDARPCLTR